MRLHGAKSNRAILISASIAVVILFGEGSLAQQPSNDNVKPTPAATGSITGHVLSSSGQNPNGAVVYVNAIGGQVPPHGAVIESDGSFRVEGLEAGVYMVWANAPGFVSDTPNASSDAPRKYYHIGDSVTLNLIKGGVITGAVTNASGQPVVAAIVHAFRVRDADGKPVPGVSQPRERATDDRGVYRVYGLQPGSYVVSAGGPGQFYSGTANPFENDAPTYAPSGTRDTATEIALRSGEEVNGVNIQYRGEAGHAITGALSGLLQSELLMTVGASVTLTDVQSRATVAVVYATSYNNYSFGFYGVADGEYELLARRSVPNGEITASEPHRIKVKGVDLVRLELKMSPLASISGQLFVESHPELNCGKRRATLLRETILTASREIKRDSKPSGNQKAKSDLAIEVAPPLNTSALVEGVPDEKGEFTLRGLYPGRYRLEPRLSGAGWYVGSISVSSGQKKTGADKSTDISIVRDGLRLKSGERLSNLAITIVEGAGGLSGRVATAEGPLPPKLQVHLVPAERDGAENVLRFFEAQVDGDGTFSIGNIAPGHYWIVARIGNERGSSTPAGPLAFDAASRSQVAIEAENAKIEVTIKRCQRVRDYDLRFIPTANTAPKQ